MLGNLRRDFQRKVHQLGLRSALWHCVQVVGRRVRALWKPADTFDAKYGTDTAGMVSVGALGVAPEKLDLTNRYEAVNPDRFGEVMDALPITYRFFEFVDLGCGKGRSLLLASKYPFERITGIELSESLVQIARENIAKCQLGNHVVAMQGDAMNFKPPASPIVLFMNNPFPAEVMQKVVTAVSKPQFNVWVVYMNHTCRECWDQSLEFRLAFEQHRCVVYRKV